MSKTIRKSLALLLSLLLVLGLLPMRARAEAETVELVEGEIRYGFASGGNAVSSDDSVAWVDADGNLNALREGTATVTADGVEYKVTVADYSDGSETVGKLKLLARYNDSMQFYDGHVYLLFTSYLDGVEITVEDLYGAYEISDAYYRDIRKDIANGSHRTGTDTEAYFTYSPGANTTVLDRGEIVTLGMYRGFELSVAEAALGCLRNSTAWKTLSDEAKTVAVDTLLEMLTTGSFDPEALLARLLGIAGASQGMTAEDWLDGKVEGGVCFNRELYNQKLEYDQYENVTYEIEITRTQLEAMTATLSGHLNQFSILKNSCATVALGAWNAAVGLREGERTAYYLDPTGEGVFALIDAPKTVKAAVMERLPGYYLNNASFVAEPDAGYYDETAGAWVYVSAPEAMEPEEGDEPVPEEPDGTLSITVQGGPTEYAEVYRLEGEEKIVLVGGETVLPGTEVFVSAGDHKAEGRYPVGVTLNGQTLPAEGDGLYRFVMPEGGAALEIRYAEYELRAKDAQELQALVGDTLRIEDHVELYAGEEPVDCTDGSVVWFGPEFLDGIAFEDETKTAVRAEQAGDYMLAAMMRDDSSILVFFTLTVYAADAGLAPVTWEVTGSGSVMLYGTCEGETSYISRSGRLVRVGSVLSYQACGYDSQLLTEITVNGQAADPAEPIVVGDEGADLLFRFSPASLSGVPEELSLPTAQDTWQLAPSVRCEDGSKPVSEVTFSYASADPLLEIDETGLVRVAGVIPKGGRAVPITVTAVSGGCTLTASCKVIVGNYDGGRVVGRLTIAARELTLSQLMAQHAYVAFVPYDHTDLSVSYYAYYQPTEQYKALMRDYANHSENYPSDPAIISEEIEIEDRAGYFEFLQREARSEAVELSLVPGETITFTSYPFTEPELAIGLDALRNGKMATSTATRALVEQLDLYLAGEDFDRPLVFDSLLEAFMEMAAILYATGENPVDGTTAGGITMDRELFSQFANTTRYSLCDCFSVELTADELASMQSWLSDPDHNLYSVLIGNCVSATCSIWNAAMYDRPELQVKASLLGIIDAPEVLRASIAGLDAPDGTHGTDYYPTLLTRIVTFDPNGGSGDMEIQYLADSIAAELNANGFTRPGRTFLGWNTEPDGSGVSYADGEQVSLTRDLTLYAQWSEAEQPHEPPAPVDDRPSAPGAGDQPAVPAPCDRGESCPLRAFVDLNVDAWYHDGVHWALEQGIMSGYGSGVFGPADATSRAMIVTMLYRLEGEPEAPQTVGFTDVADGLWYTKAIRWAAAQGIVNGYGDRFGPNDAVTREQLAAILCRYAKYLGRNTGAGELKPLPQFTDAGAVSAWAVEPMRWAVASGIINGLGDGRLSPGTDASRAQVATMLLRFAAMG